MTEERLALSELLEKAGDGDFLRAVAEAVLQLLMEADVEGLISAGRYSAVSIVKSLPIPTPNSRPILTPHWVLLRACPRSTAPWACGANGAGCPLCITPWIEVGVVSPAEAAAAERSSVDGGVHPRIRFAARDQPLLAIVRSDANGCSVALCQRRQPPKGGGRRPAFTEGCRTAILEHQERRLVSRRRVDRPERTISAPERTVRRYARILAAANIA
jgi:hypothetical protein